SLKSGTFSRNGSSGDWRGLEQTPQYPNPPTPQAPRPRPFDSPTQIPVGTQQRCRLLPQLPRSNSLIETRDCRYSSNHRHRLYDSFTGLHLTPSNGCRLEEATKPSGSPFARGGLFNSLVRSRFDHNRLPYRFVVQI
ncbi:hypothetical protein SDJN02_16874, partial [Cucurbita argyrosperma subsp. argyrosperma]